MDINNQLDALSSNGGDRSMDRIFGLIRDNPVLIPKGFEIFSANGSDKAVEMISVLAEGNPEYVPNAIQALADSQNKSAPGRILGLVNQHPKDAHIYQALDVLAENGGNLDVGAIYEMVARYPDFIPDGLEHLNKIGTQAAFEAIINVMTNHPDYQSLGLQTLKENGSALGDRFYQHALNIVTRQAASGSSGQKKRASPPAKKQVSNHGLKPEERLDHLGKDGSDKAVNDMYRIVTNYRQHKSKGLRLLGEVGSDHAVKTIGHIVRADNHYISEGIDALGQSKSPLAPIEIDELVREYPKPEHVSKALDVLGAHNSRNAIIAIGVIMKDNPNHIDEGYGALKLHLQKDEKELVIKTIGGVMDAHMKAVPEGLNILSENGSPQAMEIFDRYLEGLTGVDLTSPVKPEPVAFFTVDGFVLTPADDIAYQRFCANVEDTLEEHGIVLLPDPPEDPNNELGL